MKWRPSFLSLFAGSRVVSKPVRSTVLEPISDASTTLNLYLEITPLYTPEEAEKRARSLMDKMIVNDFVFKPLDGKVSDQMMAKQKLKCHWFIGISETKALQEKVGLLRKGEVRPKLFAGNNPDVLLKEVNGFCSRNPVCHMEIREVPFMATSNENRWWVIAIKYLI